MKRKVSSIILILLIFGFFILDVSAKSMNANVTGNLTELKSEQELTVTLRLDQNNDLKKGINAYKATLSYDKTIFETVMPENFVSQNNWEKLEYNPDTGEFVAIKRAGTVNAEDVVQVKLKVKKGMKASKTVVKLKDIVTSEGKEDITINEKNVLVDIIKEQVYIPSIVKKTNNLHPNQKIEDEINEILSSSINEEDKNKKTEDKILEELPREVETKKGVNYGLVCLVIVEIALLGLFVKKKKKKNIKEELNFDLDDIFLFVVCALVSLQGVTSVCASIYNYTVKGELNNNSVIDYDDVRLLQLHLIKKQELPQELALNADLNGDGKVTVTDLTLLVQKIEKTLDYTVSISESGIDNSYPNKNEEVTIKFYGDVSYGAKISEVIINNEKYPVSLVDELNNIYSVTLNVGDTAGVKSYKISEVILNNAKVIKVNYEQVVEVLKEVPKIDGFVVNDDINASELHVMFNVTDIDQSIVNGTFVVTDEAGNVIKEANIINGQNNIVVDVQPQVIYYSTINVSYKLDMGVINSKDYSNSLELKNNLQLVENYNFRLSDVKTYKDNIESTTFGKNEGIILDFISSNNSNYSPVKIKINDKYYDVMNVNGRFKVSLDGFDSTGEKEIKLEEVLLGNGKVIYLESNQLIVNIINKVPTVEEFNFQEENDQVKLDFNINDEDKTLRSVEVSIYNDANNIVEFYELTMDEILGNEKISKSFASVLTSKYTVIVIGEYIEASEELGTKKTLLYRGEFESLFKINIDDVSLNKNLFLKDDIVTLSYDITMNRMKDIKAIRINNTDCLVRKLSNGKYEVSYELDEQESGQKEIIAEKVIFTDDTTADINKSVTIEILKDIPVVENFYQTNKEDQVTISFDLNDYDEAFISGKVLLKDGNDIKEQEIGRNHNELTFDVIDGKIYSLEVLVTYDRDTNEDSLEYYVENQKILEKPIQYLRDYGLKITDVKTLNNNQESMYFGKNENVTVYFKSENLSIFKPAMALINGKEYNLVEINGGYQAIIDAYTEVGIKDIIIENITLSNTVKIDVNDSSDVKIEVLKDDAFIRDLLYTKTNEDKLLVMFDLVDPDGAIEGGNAIITNESGGEVKKISLQKGLNRIVTDITEDGLYYFDIYASNETDSKLKQAIYYNKAINQNDIDGLILYKNNLDKVEEITNLKVDDLDNLTNYIVKVFLKNDLGIICAPIKDKRVEDNKIILVLDYLDSNGNNLEVVYGSLLDGVAYNQSLIDSVNRMKESLGLYSYNEGMVLEDKRRVIVIKGKNK